MNYIKESDRNYSFNFPFLLSAIGFDLIVNLVTYYSIAKKFYLMEYISLGYCVFGNKVDFCPEKPQEP